MERKRYLFIDNIRWVVVLLVLLYHVFYNYNTLGVFGGIDGIIEEVTGNLDAHAAQHGEESQRPI